MNRKEYQLNFQKASPVILEKMPGFVRADHPTFVAFLEAYFEWLESDYSEFSPYDIKFAKDVDLSIDSFIDHFRNEFLVNFPKNLAVNQVTGPLDKRKLIKNIKDFYREKGTEKSFNFLFRILFDVDVDIYLPKFDILRASDGTWTEQKSIRTTVNLGTNIFKTINKQIQQIDLETNTVKGYARVSRAIVFRRGEFEVAELFLNDIQGDLQPGFPIRFSVEDQDKDFLETHTYDCVTSINVTNSGRGHIVGEFVGITGGNGTGAYGVVNRVDSDGGVLQIRMVDFGVNYTDDGSIAVQFTQTQEEADTGTPTATGLASTGALCDYQGFYSDDRGQLSSGKVLQDNRYYQDFSYVLKSEIVISRYRDIIKQLIHPAGFAFYGAVSIKRCVESDIANAHSILQFEVPLIGHYTPYTLDTTDDLSLAYPNGYFSPIAGTTLATPGNPKSDSFWIIYSHPNTRGLINIPTGTRFGDIIIDDFFHMPTTYIGNTCGVNVR